MKNKNKIQEPFDPQKTPEPAQVKDPSKGPGQEKKDVNTDKNPRGSHQEKKKSGEEPTSKKLGESETEIDDETMI